MDDAGITSIAQLQSLLERIEADLHLLITIAERQARSLELIAAKLS